MVDWIAPGEVDRDSCENGRPLLTWLCTASFRFLECGNLMSKKACRGGFVGALSG